jgi:hypothetical protein
VHHTQHGGFVFPKLIFLPLIVHLRLNPISYANVPGALGDFVDMQTHLLTVRPLDGIGLTFNTQRFALDRSGAFSLDAFRIAHLILTCLLLFISRSVSVRSVFLQLIVFALHASLPTFPWRLARFHVVSFQLLLIAHLTSLPTLPGILARFHVVCSGRHITCLRGMGQAQGQQESTRQKADDFWNRDHECLLGLG